MKKIVALGCLGVILLVGLVMVLSGVGMYNGLVKKDQEVSKQWAQVENVYQRRADLIPNLVNTVQGAASFEKSTLTDVTEARAKVGQVTLPAGAPPNAQQLASFQQAQGQLGGALSRLLVVAERYPDLKATQSFRDLQAQLEGTENRIAVERERFNQVAQDYNTSIKTFPNVLFAGICGFKERPYFTAAPGSEAPPKVQFNFNKSS